MRTVILEPAAELARQRFSESLPGFAMAYGILVADLAVHSENGWFSPGGQLESTIAMRKKPRIRVIYRYEHDTLVICQLDADLPIG
ncbi:MAG: hypothetical protein OYH76_00505 [Defluviicoccus sp.]|nr:hypothetical protein [Defluviicoccus sp.]MDE0274344.1 hypothetical protein [Defluviicoccus sp.]